MYEQIRSKIIEVIRAQSTRVFETYRTDRSDIKKYPAALVIPSQSEADFHETDAGSAKEAYVFTIRVIHPFVEGQDNADIAIEKALDNLITIFRNKKVLGTAADWVIPSPSVWGYQTRGNGICRIGELKIRAVKYISSTSP